MINFPLFSMNNFNPHVELWTIHRISGNFSTENPNLAKCRNPIFVNLYRLMIDVLIFRGFQDYSDCVNSYKPHCDFTRNKQYRAFRDMCEYICKDKAGQNLKHIFSSLHSLVLSFYKQSIGADWRLIPISSL